MISQGARTMTVGQRRFSGRRQRSFAEKKPAFECRAAPARDCWSRKSTKQPRVVWSISASARTKFVGRSSFLVASWEIATQWVARASATPGGATQLVGARCVPRWRRLAKGRSRPSVGWRSLAEQVARPNFLRGQAKKWWGLAKGVGPPPWLRAPRSLCLFFGGLTFCRMTESKCLRG